MSDLGEIPAEVIKEVRKQAVQQTAKWLIGGFVALLVLAAVGWWFFFEPKIRDYIADAAGGVPKGTVVASTVACSEFGSSWIVFAEGKGRVLIGAGPEALRAYNMWDKQLPGGGVEPTELSNYDLLGTGGEERHTIAESEMPAHGHEFEGTTVTSGGWGGDVSNDIGVGNHGKYRTYTPEGNIAPTGGSQPHNNMPPYIALNFCKKA